MVPATEEDVLGLFDDLLEEPLGLLEAGNLRLVVGLRSRQTHAFVTKGGAGGVGHHHRAQSLLMELAETQEAGSHSSIRSALFFWVWCLCLPLHNDE